MDASFDVSVIWIIFLDNFRELEISILFHWQWSDENLKICSCFHYMETSLGYSTLQLGGIIFCISWRDKKDIPNSSFIIDKSPHNNLSSVKKMAERINDQSKTSFKDGIGEQVQNKMCGGEFLTAKSPNMSTLSMSLQVTNTTALPYQ